MADKNISLPTAGELGISIRFVKRGPGGVKTHKKASAELREQKKVKRSKRAKVTVDIFDSPDLREWNNSVARFRAETEDMCPPFGMGGDRFLANTLANEFADPCSSTGIQEPASLTLSGLEGSFKKIAQEVPGEKILLLQIDEMIIIRSSTIIMVQFVHFFLCKFVYEFLKN